MRDARILIAALAALLVALTAPTVATAAVNADARPAAPPVCFGAEQGYGNIQSLATFFAGQDQDPVRWRFDALYAEQISDYQVLDQSTGEVSTVPRADDPEAAGTSYTYWTPPHVGSYEVSATYYVEDCLASGMPPVRRGPLTATATFRLAAPPPWGRPSFTWQRQFCSRDGCAMPCVVGHGRVVDCPAGSAELSGEAPTCGAVHLTIVMRYTLDGRRPGSHSRGWERTARCDDRFRMSRAFGRWGEAGVGSGKGAFALAIATPGTRMRVLVEWRSSAGPVGAIRADSHTKRGKVSWTTDAAGCRAFPTGCASLRQRSGRPGRS